MSNCSYTCGIYSRNCKYYLLSVLLMQQLCTVSVAVGMDAELDEWSVYGNVTQTEDRIVSQWSEVSVDEKHQLRDKFDEILRPLGLQTRLVVMERASSLALYFICLTLSAVMNLRNQWLTGQLIGTVQSLFNLLSDTTRTVLVRRLSWPQTDYYRCLEFYGILPGEQTF